MRGCKPVRGGEEAERRNADKEFRWTSAGEGKDPREQHHHEAGGVAAEAGLALAHLARRSTGTNERTRPARSRAFAMAQIGSSINSLRWWPARPPTRPSYHGNDSTHGLPPPMTPSPVTPGKSSWCECWPTTGLGTIVPARASRASSNGRCGRPWQQLATQSTAAIAASAQPPTLRLRGRSTTSTRSSRPSS